MDAILLPCRTYTLHQPCGRMVVSVARRKARIDPSKLSLDELAELPGMYDLYMYDMRDGHTWDRKDKMPHKRLVTGNPQAGYQWILKCEGWGLLTWEDVEEQQNMLRAVIKSAQIGAGEGKYDPASVANKTSGKGMKGSRKPTRDYQNGTAANNGNYTGVTRMGRDYGHGRD